MSSSTSDASNPRRRARIELELIAVLLALPGAPDPQRMKKDIDHLIKAQGAS